MDFSNETYFELVEKDFDKAKGYKNNFIPEYLYKFISLDQIPSEKLETLKNDSIWLTSKNTTNDKYECKAFYYDTEEASKLGANEQYHKLIEESLNRISNNIFLASLTNDMYKNINMWSSYAGNYKGLCIKYKVIDPDKIFNVIYDEKRINYTKSFLTLIHEINKKSKNNEVIKSILNIYFGFNYCMKHNAWAHENEYRLIDIDIDNLLLCLIAETDSNGKGYNLSHDAAGLQVEEIYLGPYFDDSGNSLSAQINEITDLLSIPKAKKTSLCEKEYKISILRDI